MDDCWGAIKWVSGALSFRGKKKKSFKIPGMVLATRSQNFRMVPFFRSNQTLPSGRPKLGHRKAAQPVCRQKPMGGQPGLQPASQELCPEPVPAATKGISLLQLPSHCGQAHSVTEEQGSTWTKATKKTAWLSARMSVVDKKMQLEFSEKVKSWVS